MDLTVSIVSHGHGQLLHALLGDLQVTDSARSFRVMVTLNTPDDAVHPARYAPLSVEILENAAPKGFGANHNAAFRHCQTEWFAVLNPDLRLPTDPFPKLMEAAAGLQNVGVLAPLIVDSSGRIEDSVRSNLSPASVLRRSITRDRGVQDSRTDGAFYWFAGMFMLFRAEAFAAIGGFDERFFLYCEDYDVCARLHLAGYALGLQPESKVVHDAQRDSHKSLQHLRMHVSSLAKVWVSGTFWRILLNSAHR